VAAFVFFTIFSHSEGWWGRYAPQAWLLPLLVALGCLLAERRPLLRAFGFLLMLLAAADMLYVGCYFAKYELGYTKSMRKSLREMAQAGEPVKVYLGEFHSLRERLREHHIVFQITDQRPSAEEVPEPWHAIPRNQGFWFADHLNPQASNAINNSGTVVLK
jgi:hypothetical protein